jgi:hypothetical protein
LSVRWQTAEALGAAYYIEKGYSVSFPIGDSRHYDFIAEKEGEFLRVNVKKAYRTKKTGWAISSAGFAKVEDDREAIERFLVWMPEHKVFIEFNGDFFRGSKSRSKNIPASIVGQLCS